MHDEKRNAGLEMKKTLLVSVCVQYYFGTRIMLRISSASGMPSSSLLSSSCDRRRFCSRAPPPPPLSFFNEWEIGCRPGDCCGYNGDLGGDSV